MIERTFVLIKPEAFDRFLIGEIISRFERAGLMLEEMKKVNATTEIAEKYVSNDKNWIKSVGKKTIYAYKKYDLDLIKDLGTNDVLKIGKLVRKWLIEHLTSGPVVAIILSGNHAIESARKIVGNTVPLFAELGSIRGDFSTDTSDLSNREKRVILNLVHASETVEEAEREISVWFEELDF